MAELRRVEKEQVVLLESELLIGRSVDCRLRLAEGYVSGRHAAIRWNGAGWEVRDLASTNGTFIEGVRVTPGHPTPLQRGQVVCFGDLAERWQLADDSPPKVILVPEHGVPFAVDGDLIALPSAETPQATLYRGSDGSWRLERPESVDTPLSNGDAFQVDGSQYRFTCPDVLAPTTNVIDAEDVRSVLLHFSVSKDEEYVEIRATLRERTIALRPRNHDYLLLILARKRLADRNERLPESECGWMYQDELERGLGVCQNQMNIDIHRIRREFAALDLRNPAEIIERRPRMKYVRIGTAHLSISEL